ncbi:MAG TPA: hypothetical protein VGG79_25360 [Roseiarcus sp.]
MAQRFGLVCAAGELGVQFGILPWEQSDALNDASELLKVWLDERGGGSAPYEARQAIAQVRHFIEAHGDSRFDDITTPDPDRKPVANRAGFRRDHGEARRWLVPPEVWRNEVCAGLNAREVAKTLAGLHVLEPDGEGKFSRSETVGGRKQRFYVLKPAIFEGWDEAIETSSEHLEHQAHVKMRCPKNAVRKDDAFRGTPFQGVTGVPRCSTDHHVASGSERKRSRSRSTLLVQHQREHETMTMALRQAPQHGYRLSAFDRKDHDFYPTPADLVASLPLGLSRLGLELPRIVLDPRGATARSAAAWRPLGST